MTSTTPQTPTPQTPTPQTRTPLTARQKVGHVIGLVLGLDMLTTFFSDGSGDDATPWPVLGLILVMMLLVLGLLAWSWASGRRLPRRIAAVLLVLNALLAVPGLFLPDVATWMRIDAGACVLGTIVAVVLMFYPDRRVRPA
jgi:peptidoglycan/LPS O-acetylase OafA/YrhL